MPSSKAGSGLNPPPHSQAGIAAIEFGLLAPFLVLLLVAATEIGSGIYQDAAEGTAAFEEKRKPRFGDE